MNTPLILNRWIIILSTYLALIAIHGYRFGDEDMSETLSYALFMNDHSLYVHDLYIQAVGESRLNERYPFTLLLSLFKGHLEWSSFFLHFATSLLLIVGLLSIAELYLKQKLLQFVFLLSSLILVYNITLGGNEIWYNYFVPSHLAKSIGVWGIFFWLRKKPLNAYGAVALATFAQPVVGAQLALLFAVLDGFQVLQKSTWRVKEFFGPIIYASTAGIWIVFVFTSHLLTDQAVDAKVFYQMMETRLGHHFFPSYYPLKSWFFLIPLFFLSAYLWQRVDRRVYHLFMVSFMGMALYIIGVEVLELPFLLSVQWFKITVWLKSLSILAIFMLLEQRIKKFPPLPVSLAAAILVTICILQLSGLFQLAQDKPYHFPSTNYYTADMRIGLELKRLLPEDVSIIIPPDVTGVRYFSERSIFIDYKSNIHSKSYLAAADKRRRELYNMTLQARQAGNLMHGCISYYNKLPKSELQKYKSQGATHVLTHHEHQLELPLIVKNEAFNLYAL